MNAYLAVSSLLVASVTLFFLVSVLLKGVRKKRNFTFCIFAISVFTWSFGHMLWQLSDSEKEAIFWIRVLIVGSSLIPYAYLHFVTEFVGRPMPKLVGFGYLIASILCVLAWSPYIFSGVEQRMSFEFWPVAGPVFAVYFGGFIFIVLLCYLLLFDQYRKASIKVRNQNKYMIIGTAIGFFGGGTNFPLWLNIQISPLLHGLSIFYILGIGYSVLKYRLLDFNEMAIRVLGLLTLSVALGFIFAGVFSFLMGYAYSDFSPNGYYLWTGIFSALSFLYLIISPTLYHYVDSIIQAKLVSARFAYRHELKELSDKSISIIQHEDTAPAIVEGIFDIMSLDFAALYTRTGMETGYYCMAAKGSRPRAAELDSSTLDPLIRIVYESPHAHFIEEETDRSAAFRRSMNSICEKHPQIRMTDVVVPVAVQNSFYGFLVLGSSSLHGAFAEVDLLILENLCSQYALALKSREVERMANRVEKLVSLGTMAAGLSHELRNPLVSIRTFASLLKKEPASSIRIKPEFSQTIQRDIKRISGIVEGVSAFAQDTNLPMAYVVVADTLEEASTSLSEKLQQNNIELRTRVEKNVPHALGNYEQLIQVFQNILENAIHAISEWENRPEAGSIYAHIRMRGGGHIEQKSWVEVKMRDNGPGMSSEFQSRIFDPFVTSRDTGTRQGASGTGLGLAIVSKIIERHSGKITVDSSVGKGAVFTISIPSVED